MNVRRHGGQSGAHWFQLRCNGTGNASHERAGDTPIQTAAWSHRSAWVQPSGAHVQQLIENILLCDVVAGLSQGCIGAYSGLKFGGKAVNPIDLALAQ